MISLLIILACFLAFFALVGLGFAILVGFPLWFVGSLFWESIKGLTKK